MPLEFLSFYTLHINLWAHTILVHMCRKIICWMFLLTIKASYWCPLCGNGYMFTKRPIDRAFLFGCVCVVNCSKELRKFMLVSFVCCARMLNWKQSHIQKTHWKRIKNRCQNAFQCDFPLICVALFLFISFVRFENVSCFSFIHHRFVLVCMCICVFMWLAFGYIIKIIKINS